jgi:hypothetical protein
MKLLTAIAACAVTAAFSLSFGSAAFAQSNPSGLTHAEVIAQLQQAQAQGLVPTPNNDYPPSATTIARNREIYAIQHGTDGAHETKTAATPATQVEPASN